MNQQLGATYSLSLLIVVSVGVVGSQTDSIPKQRAANVQESAKRVTTATKVTRSYALSPVDPSPLRELRTRELPTKSVANGSRVLPVSQVRATRKPEARGAFTSVAAGESLTTVARRVYGSSEEVAKLWRANRDQLATETTALREGMTLRTP